MISSPLESVLLVDVPDKVFKYEIESVLKVRWMIVIVESCLATFVAFFDLYG